MTDIDTSTWKEFKISDLFEIKKVKGKTIKEYESGSIPYVSGTSSNNGVINKVSSLGNDISEGNCLTVDPITGFTAYQEEDFIGRGFSGASIVALYNENLTRENAEFFCAVIYKKIHESASYSNLYNTKRLADVTILLPAKEEYVPDFDYMESYIKEIEKESITRMKKERERKIEAGRKAIGEEKIFSGNDEIDEDVEWGEFELNKLFNSETGVYDIKKDDIEENGKFYVVSAGESNHGLIGKTNINVKCIEPNTITVDMFGHVFAHDIKYTMVTHARVFALIPKEQLPMNICNFLACSIRKICMLFSYSNMASWNKIKDKTIQLPVDRATGNPDWKYMENYISILQKKQSDKVFERLKKEYPDC